MKNPSTKKAPVVPRPPVRWHRAWAAAFLGMIIGGLFGFVVYWSGAALLAAAALIEAPTSQLPSEMMRPFQGFTAWEIVLVSVGALMGATVARSKWHSAGLLSYVALLSVIGGYVVYTLTVSIPHVPESQRWLSYTLLVAESCGLALVVIFSFYSLDASTRRRWNRVARDTPWDPQFQPHVAIQIPMYDEPFDIVEQTIIRAVNQEYPADRFTVQRPAQADGREPVRR